MFDLLGIGQGGFDEGDRPRLSPGEPLSCVGAGHRISHKRQPPQDAVIDVVGEHALQRIPRPRALARVSHARLVVRVRVAQLADVRPMWRGELLDEPKTQVDR
jgi:hypothetical protein